MKQRSPFGANRRRAMQKRAAKIGQPETWGHEPLYRLRLPLPPSPNRVKKHHYAEHRQKREYQAEAWAAAVRQARPLHEMDVPKLVRIQATFFLRRQLRDEDNLAASLKFALDALKLRQTGGVEWRQGAYDEKGYFYDDDPAHLSIESVRQVAQRKDHRLEIEIWR